MEEAGAKDDGIRQPALIFPSFWLGKGLIAISIAKTKQGMGVY